MNYNINTQATTFWNFLKGNTIEIPIIQRDYAQGRLGEENLRKNFLADLKIALDSNKTIMKLDFVYGSKENNKLNPLDGQQRLTTLWLLHWYIALRAGELNDDNCEFFKRFTYETRISSREFCQNLCKSENFKVFEGNDIVGFITKQTWFYSAWKQDPTIQSMLRMLGGTKISDKKGEDIIDGIEELFQETNEDDFKSYWEKLTQTEVIVFYHLPLRDFGLSDDLYIKMNARGKQLTSFENFKADLIGYITNQAEDKSLEGSVRAEWKKLIDPKSGIPIKIDTDWTDIFWKNKSKESKIDEIYFAFINRFFLQELICAKKEDKTDLYSADNLENKNVTLRHLYGEKGDDSQLQYSGLAIYLLNDGGAIPLNFFTSLSETLNNLKPNLSGCKFFVEGCINVYFPTWVDSEFEYIPKYDEIGKITTLGQKERVVFLAISRYFEKGGFNNESFKQWMRVVWNIVENSGIETISAMIGAMRLIDELSDGAYDIYNFLSNSQLQVNSNFAKDQVAEEIAKAKQIFDENGNLRKYNGPCKKNDGLTWEDIIIDAEKCAFFKGSIRFLFTNEKGEINWDYFDTKLKKAQEYFDKNGVKDEYKENAKLLRAYISKFNKWSEFWDFDYDNKPSTWKQLLISKRYMANHDILMYSLGSDNFSSFNSKLEEYDKEYKDRQETVQNELVKTNILVNSSKWGMKLNWRGDHNTYCLYPYNTKAEWKIYVIGNKRNPVLSNLVNENKINSDQKIEGLDFFWGWNINFEYNGYKFQWNTDGNVYLIDKDGKRKVKNAQPQEEFYCFNAEGIENINMLEELNKLILPANI